MFVPVATAFAASATSQPGMRTPACAIRPTARRLGCWLTKASETLAVAWRPYVETWIETFGPSRSMFESNFPVDKGSYSYPVFWNACKLLTKGLNSAERADLFTRTAARFYRLDAIG